MRGTSRFERRPARLSTTEVRDDSIPGCHLLVGLCGMAMAALTAGCFDSSSRSTAVQVDTLASGAVLVRNNPIGADLPPAGWRVLELHRLGSADGPGEATVFGRIDGLEIDPTGRVYVLDTRPAVVRVFGPDGEFLDSFGRRGSGPGEFGRPDGIVIGPDGRIWVRDSGNQRYAVFELDGTYRDTYRRSFGGGPWEPVIDPNGVFWEESITRLDLETGDARAVFLGLSPRNGTMEAVDTVERPPRIRGSVWTVEPATLAGTGVVQSGFVSVPFSAQVHERIDPRGGYWRGRTDALRFVRVSARGDTLRIVERVAPRRPVTATDRDQAVRELTDRFGAGLRVEPEKIPPDMPYWSTFFLDAHFRLWVERYRPPGAVASQPRSWEVYDSSGVYLGVLELPHSGRPTPRLRNDRLVGVVEDELDVPFVVVLELRFGQANPDSGS